MTVWQFWIEFHVSQAEETCLYCLRISAKEEENGTPTVWYHKLSISLTVKHIFIWDAKWEVDINEKQKLE